MSADKRPGVGDDGSGTNARERVGVEGSPQRHGNAQSMPLGTQLMRFVGSGVLAALVDFGILSLLMAFGLGYVPAKAISWVAGTLTAYVINRRWTFNASKSRRRLLAVLVLYGITFAAQVSIFSVGYPFAQAHLGNDLAARVVAFVVAQGVATVINFIVQRTVIFRDRAK